MNPLFANPTPRKTRPDDVLGNLPKADQDRILDMLDHRSYRDVLQEINQPAPEGLGLKIQYNSLRKFYLKHLPIRVAEERPEIAGDWKLLAEAAARDPIDLQNVIRESLEREVYLAFQYSEPTNPRPMKLLDRLLRWRGQDIAKARLHAKSGKSNPASFFLPDFLNSMPAPSGQPNLASPFPGIPPVPPTGATTPTPDPTMRAMLQSMISTPNTQASAQPAAPLAPHVDPPTPPPPSALHSSKPADATLPARQDSVSSPSGNISAPLVQLASTPDEPVNNFEQHKTTLNNVDCEYLNPERSAAIPGAQNASDSPIAPPRQGGAVAPAP